MDYKSELDKRYTILDQNPPGLNRLYVLNDIIQLKQAGGISLRNYKRTLYQDVKVFFREYVIRLFDKDNNYDVLNFSAINEKILLLDSDERVNALKLLERELKKDYRESESKECYYLRKKYELKHYWKLSGLKSKIKLVFALASWNLISIILTFIFLVLVFALITYPLDSFPIKLFTIKQYSYCQNETANHILNVVAQIFELNEESKITPMNVGGILISLLIKGFFVFVLGEYLLSELHKRISVE